jgi:hypothetical protein
MRWMGFATNRWWRFAYHRLMAQSPFRGKDIGLIPKGFTDMSRWYPEGIHSHEPVVESRFIGTIPPVNVPIRCSIPRGSQHGFSGIPPGCNGRGRNKPVVALRLPPANGSKPLRGKDIGCYPEGIAAMSRSYPEGIQRHEPVVSRRDLQPLAGG